MITRLLSAALFAAASLALCAPAAAAELVIGLGADVTSIDPHNNNAAPNNSIAEQIFNKLIENDARQNPKPGLAESWRTVDDLTWEFKLRRGVKFHDGSDFTAADVAYSIERPGIINTPGGFTIYTRSIVDKTIVDPVHHTAEDRDTVPQPADRHGGTDHRVEQGGQRRHQLRTSTPARRRSAPARGNSCATSKATASNSRAMTTTGAPSRRGTR